MEASKSSGRSFADINILIAEDEVINQRVVTKILSDAGYGSNVVDDGCQVIRALESSKYDLILMDFFLPGMDGVEITRAIRNGQSDLVDPDIPIIALTALDSREHLEKCTAAGMNASLTKPAKPKLLLATIARLLAGDRVEPGTADDSKGGIENPLEPEHQGKESVDFMPDDAVIDKFLQEVPNEISRLHSALETEDLSTIEFISHRLKGAMAYLGASGLADRIAELEKAGSEGDLERAKNLVSELTRGMEIFHVEVSSGESD